MILSSLHRILRLILSIALLTICCKAADTAYTISLESPAEHLVQVQIILSPGPPTGELHLPVWNALYQVRDFAQFVNWIRVKDRAGHPVQIRSLNNSRWQVEGVGNGAVVEYQIYVDSFGPFGAQLNAHHAFLNLAQILMYPSDARNDAMTVRFSHARREWHIVTPLTFNSGAYAAENYDRLVDSPFELG